MGEGYSHISGMIMCEDIKNRDIILGELEYLEIEHGLFFKDKNSSDIFFDLELKGVALDEFIHALKDIASFKQEDKWGEEWDLEGIFNLISSDDITKMRILRIRDGILWEVKISDEIKT